MTVRAATILIVDDEIKDRKLLEVLLRHEGYLTRCAESGEEALTSIAQQAPDLILLDVMMPGMNGYELARTLKGNAATANIPIVMVTTQKDRSARLAGLKAGAEEFLTKPVDRSDLWLRVRNLLRLKEMGDFHQNHGNVLEQQIQARTAELQDFRTAMDATADAIMLLNRSTMRFVEVNATACNMLGYTRDELFQMDPSQLGVATLEQLASAYDTLIAGHGTTEVKETRLLRKDGSQLHVEVRRHAHRSGANWIIVGVVRDITERKEAEDRIRHLNRLYGVLSGINTLMVRVHDQTELFHDACRIAVETGGFKLAWVGVVDRSTMQLKPVAWAGVGQDYFERMPLSLIEGDREKFGLGGRAVLEKQPIVIQDIEHDPQILLLREARERGFRSLVVLPLIVSGTVFGVLALYAGESGFFNDSEMKLLRELAGDIAFAIDHLDKLEKLDYLAYYDAVTGLANRSFFLERVAQFIRSAASGGHQLAVFLIDLERFRNINDSLGRPAGDLLLKQVAEWLTHHLGDAGLTARVGADHFAVVVPDVRQAGDVAKQVEKTLVALLGHAFRLNDSVFRIAAKVGVAIFPDDGADADTLFKNAEASLKKAKAVGARYLFYTQKMTETVATRLTLENQLRQALDNEEFVLHYQPKITLASGKLTGAEALIRWNHPRSGLVPPGLFVPVLEETGLIHEVGRWALRKAIEDYLRWRTAGLAAVRIAVNVSPLQLRNSGFFAEIKRAIGVDARASAGLELEITESLIMEEVQHSIASLRAIRALGVSIAIDDFGTGFSSLSYLARLPVDTLKIDRSFVTDMTAGPEGLALVSTVISLAHALKLKVVAEGVETEAQSHQLRLLNCDEVQGFLFSPGVPAEVFENRFLALPAGRVAPASFIQPTLSAGRL